MKIIKILKCRFRVMNNLLKCKLNQMLKRLMKAPMRQKKYIVPLEGKKWVLSTIGDNWRTYKCRLKKDHYYKYNTDRLRILNRPKNMPEDKFKELLKYWNSTNVKRITEINVANRKRQKNMHTVGKKSFAKIRKKLQEQKENKEEPTRTEMFIETRKRKIGRTYKESDEDILNKIAQMQEVQSQHTSESNPFVDPFSLVIGGMRPGRAMLYGRGVTPTDLKSQSNMTESSMKIPEELLQSMKTKWQEEVRTEMIKEMEQRQATWNQQMLLIFSQLQSLNPELNLNPELFGALVSKSPGDANSALNQVSHARTSPSLGASVD